MPCGSKLRFLVGVVALAVAGAIATPLTAGAGGASVSMKEGPPGCSTPSYCYTPNSVTIAPGDTVTWTDLSDAPHTVTRCTPAACQGNGPGTGTDNGPQSGTVNPNQTYSFTFHGPGTYLYYCTIHGYAVMHGLVTVAAAAAGATPSSTAAPPASPTPAGGAQPGAVAPPPTGAHLPLVTALVLVAAGCGVIGASLRRRRY
jgi:plastocyanin